MSLLAFGSQLVVGLRNKEKCEEEETDLVGEVLSDFLLMAFELGDCGL